MMQRIVVILGPTAGGKSDLAVAVARRFNGEIINADSMQVYKHLDAGTAKPTAEQRAAVPHHLVDVVEPTESWTVADWLGRAEGLIAEVRERGHVPVVVGGTNLYLKALLEGMFDGPPADEAYRASLEKMASEDLHRQLREVDSEAASRIFPQDRKRIVRALEVFHTTGQPISSLQTQWVDEKSEIRNPKSEIYRYDPVLIGLRWEVEAINRRINARVKAMFAPPVGSRGPDEGEDLIAETRRLEAAGLLGDQARQAIGTKQVLDHFAGKYTAEEAMEQVKIDTRRFAKAQRTWLKRYRGVHWFDASEGEWEALVVAALAVVASELGTTS
ncbi:MAG: tRNA (adenosine(37)-N6)-dimethylallyltransferase MiaA [Phycisphaera sp.]|nr:tRNA (adenosine(37)-N6)-dimethylallyltransferase MiaA [Phycisphaera sp.]